MLVNLTVECVVEIDAVCAGVCNGDVVCQKDGVFKSDGSVIDGDVCFQLGRTGGVCRKTFQSRRPTNFGVKSGDSVAVDDQVRTRRCCKFVNCREERDVIPRGDCQVSGDVDRVLEGNIGASIDVVVQDRAVGGVNVDRTRSGLEFSQDQNVRSGWRCHSAC